LKEILVAAVFQIDVVIIGHSVKAHDLETRGEEVFAQVISDKSGAAGHQNAAGFLAHGLVSFMPDAGPQ
jgi:hypothetical protein